MCSMYVLQDTHYTQTFGSIEMIRVKFYILILVLVGCTDSSNNSVNQASENKEESKNDTVKNVLDIGQTEGMNTFSIYDSLETAIVDTTTLGGKREWLMNQFMVWNTPSGPDFDTLFDLNFDGNHDYVIGFYGQSGTGLKHGIKVYIYNEQTGCYHKDSLLSSLPNPSFYLREKKITSFYLPYGAGYCTTLQWINGNWTIAESIEVVNDESESVWVISYPRTGKEKRIKHAYQGIPPQEILKNEYGEY